MRPSDIATDENAKLLIDARLYASIVESSADAIITKSLDGIIQSWNATAVRMFGYSAEAAIGRHISLLIPADRADEENWIIARMRAGERVEHYATMRVRSWARKSMPLSPIPQAKKAKSSSARRHDGPPRIPRYQYHAPPPCGASRKRR